MRATTSLILALVLAAPGLGGCLMTSMRTADRLEAGETVVSFAGDIATFSARGTGQVLVGTGTGDVGLHGGIGFPWGSAGLSKRFYLGDSLNLGGQFEYYLLAGGELIWNMPLYSGALELTTVLPALHAPGDSGLYGGLSLFFAGGGPLMGVMEAHPGLLGGYEVRANHSTNFQIQAVVYPTCVIDLCSTGLGQVSLGFNYSGERVLGKMHRRLAGQ